MKPTRERLLDAYEDIIVSHGAQHATLDAVAERARVSKGGLMYHFASKDALVDALCQRLKQRVDADADAMHAAPEGAALYYLRTSFPSNSPLDSTMLAVARLQDENYPQAREAGTYAATKWQEALQEEVADPDVARVIKLIGDGLYYGALFEGTEAVEEPGVLAVAQRLLDTVKQH